MPVFRIEQYELHTHAYSVEADSEAEAIRKLLDGNGEPVDDSQEFVEVAEERGMAVENHRQLAEQLRALGVPVTRTMIPSIRSIEVSANGTLGNGQC